MKAPQVGVDIYLRGDSLSFNLSPKDFMKLNCYSSCTQRSLRLPLSNKLLKYIHKTQGVSPMSCFSTRENFAMENVHYLSSIHT